MVTAVVLSEELAAARRAVHPADRLVIDLRGIEFLGSAGIECLLDAQRRCGESGAPCWIVANQRVVLRPLNTLGIADRFAIVERVEHALPAASGERVTSQPTE